MCSTCSSLDSQCESHFLLVLGCCGIHVLPASRVERGLQASYVLMVLLPTINRAVMRAEEL